MDEPINRGHRHNAVREDLIPFAERLIGRNDEAAAFVAVGDELEQDVSLRIRFFHIADIVNDEYPVFVPRIQLASATGGVIPKNT